MEADRYLERMNGVLRHAYLIMAYNQYELLNYLLRMLDHPQNVIFVHIDKKSPVIDLEKLTDGVKYSRVNVYQEIKVYWGHFSQTECEIFLLEKALEQDCDYFHLLSGEDLPLKSQDEIHRFFEMNNGKEYVRFWGPQLSEQSVEWMAHYHPLQKYLRISRNGNINSAIVRFDSTIQLVQRILNINRIKGHEEEFQKGATWFSITRGLAEEIISKKKWIEGTFKSSRSSDEVFVQTILKNSKYAQNRYESSYELDGLMGLHYIDWTRGKPYVFRESDFDELVNSGYFFARKFNMNIDSNIVKKLYKYVTSFKA